jgi:hypothetical protein
LASPRALLAMQKVEGSNPFSRFSKGLHLRVFGLGSRLFLKACRRSSVRLLRPLAGCSQTARSCARCVSFQRVDPHGPLLRGLPQGPSEDPGAMAEAMVRDAAASLAVDARAGEFAP